MRSFQPPPRNAALPLPPPWITLSPFLFPSNHPGGGEGEVGWGLGGGEIKSKSLRREWTSTRLLASSEGVAEDPRETDPAVPETSGGGGDLKSSTLGIEHRDATYDQGYARLRRPPRVWRRRERAPPSRRRCHSVRSSTSSAMYPSPNGTCATF